MATDGRSRAAAVPRSGGKMVKPRRAAAARTPYDRPEAASAASRSPGWLSGFIFPATRKIASGAGKLISTVLGSDASSSSSSSDGESGSEDEDEIADDGNDVSLQVPDSLDKNGTPSVMVKRFDDEQQAVVGETDTKRLIEQLLLRETFSREESDRFIEIIKLRSEHSLTIKSVSDVDVLTSSSPVVKARKWLEETQLGLKGDVDSPVNVARSYMQSRPAWASPSVNIDFPTSSPISMNPFTERTPYALHSGSSSMSKPKKDSLASGSWNLGEEMRRVRSKATEEMLKNSSSNKSNLSSAFASEHKASEHQPHKAVEVCDLCSPGDGAKGDDLLNEVMPSNPRSSVIEIDKDVEDPEIIEGRQFSGMPNAESEPHDDSRPNDREHLPIKELAAAKGTESALGCPSPDTSSFAETDMEPDSKLSKEEQPLHSSHNKITNNVSVKTCGFLSEASMEIPNVNDIEIPTKVTAINETDNGPPMGNPTGNKNNAASMEASANEIDNAADVPHNVSTVHNNELQDPTRPNSNQGNSVKTDGKLEQHQGQKRGRYTTRSRKSK